MMKMIAALCVAVPCAASAQASQQRASATMADGPLTLEQAVAAAGGSAPMMEAASAGVEAARAARTTAALRPNPSLQGQVENVVGSGPYRGLRSAETTLGVAVPIELGGKRGARIAVADAQLSRAELQAAMTAADVRYQVTQLYVEAVAAARRLSTAGDQHRVTGDALHAAQVRVQAGRASPLEEQRAMVARALSLARLEQTERLAGATRENLARRIGRPVDGPLDDAWLDALPPVTYGPSAIASATGTLTLAAAEADLAVTDANVRLFRAARVPDLTVGPALRRLSATNDTAAVFSVSLPIPLFNAGRSALAQARSERVRADSQRRATALDVEQAITDARAEVANAAASARAASGPAMTAAAEAARIARIGYREGKFGQLDLLDAERTLADTRLAAIDALATYHNAQARLERLTAPVPQGETLP